MKNSIVISFFQKTLFFALFGSLTFACSKKDDATASPTSTTVELPTNVVGTFTGQLSYVGPSTTPISNSTNGTATLTKTGSKTYTIAFSDGAPSITNLKFQTSTNGAYSTIDSDGSIAGMTLSPNNLTIGFVKGSETWGFTGSK